MDDEWQDCFIKAPRDPLGISDTKSWARQLSESVDGEGISEFCALSERIVAVGLLTKNDVRLLGPAFDRLWPLDGASDFSGLLRAIDDADQELSRPPDRGHEPY